ncbi:MAG TPA: hypothetical protein VJZ76_22965 [Thermoanaerobaculia bacterium]|nr:hypothetical protein [Thermoanaerobaculia bacterium]
MTRILTLLGTPSIPLLALVLDLLLRRRLFTPRERRALLWWSASLSLVLYSSTLGYLPVDVYRAGFSSWAPVVFAALALAVATRSLPLALTALATLVAYDVPLFRSVNLFDYAVDPMLGIVAIGWAAYTAFRTAANFSANRDAS